MFIQNTPNLCFLIFSEKVLFYFDKHAFNAEIFLMQDPFFEALGSLLMQARIMKVVFMLSAYKILN
jgi:hypothetical protein